MSRAKAPGRNYKLLPALATNSPPDCLLNASRPQRSFGMRENKRLFSHCRDFRPRLSVIFFFSGEEKRNKKVAGTLAIVSRAKAPGRNYKLLPALATNSPPDCLLNASRPQRSFGMRENKHLFSHCRDFRPRLSVIFFFQAKKKEAKKSPGHLRLCPGPRNAFRYVRLFNELRPLTLFLESFLSTFFKNKVGNLQCISRKTNYDTTTTPAQKILSISFKYG